MPKLKVLNLYCGIGGNRKLWKDEEVEVTAVEINQDIAGIYKGNFPNDKVIVGEAHEYLLKHYEEYDFIWSSPPCPTHSRTNYFLKAKGIIRYPCFKLYEEIVFLNEHFEGKWIVENVIPYYEPLIVPCVIGRHCFWANFLITKIKQKKDSIGRMNGKNQKANKIPLKERNALNSDLGLHIFNCAYKEKQTRL